MPKPISAEFFSALDKLRRIDKALRGTPINWWHFVSANLEALELHEKGITCDDVTALFRKQKVN